MGKFPTFFLLLLLAVFAAAIFGALHNQLSYTVGPTYFTDFKFLQFNVSDTTPPRLGAAYVGIMASWWMGAIIGLPAFLYGLLAVPNPRSYLAAGLGSIFLVILLATFGALLGLLGGIVADTTDLLDGYIIDPTLAFPTATTPSDFLRAGFMHNASYLAGALGLIAAIFPMRRARQVDLHNSTKGVPHAT